MTTTENTTTTTPAIDVSTRPGLSDLIANRPEGTVAIIAHPRYGEVRAYPQRTGSVVGESYHELYPTHGDSTDGFNYVGQSWHSASGGNGVDYKIGHERWVEIPLPSATPSAGLTAEEQQLIDDNTGLLDKIANAPAGTVVILRDSHDGELRAFPVRGGGEVEGAFQVFPVRSFRPWNYTAREWTPMTPTYGSATLVGDHWSEIPLDLAARHRAPETPEPQPEPEQPAEPQAEQFPGLDALLANLPEGTVVVIRDSTDGELRAYPERSRIDCPNVYNAYPNQGVTWPRDYTGKAWNRYGFGSGAEYFLGSQSSRWSEIPLPPAAEPETPAEASPEDSQLAEARRINDQLRAEVNTANQSAQRHLARISELERQHAAFRQQVAEVASRYGKEHDWCSVVDQALGELGLERLPDQVEYCSTLVIRVEFTATRTGDNEVPDEGWVKSSLNCESDLRRVIKQNFSLDSDNEVESIDSIEFEIDGVDEN